jgi:hypothetical protein
MTSSGQYNFTMSNGETVLEAFSRINVRPTSIRQEHMVDARRALNLLLVEAANKQVNLWKVELISVPMISGQLTYTVPARVVMMLDAWITTGTGVTASDTTITPISRTEYASMSNKQTPGRPTSFWFDRLIAPTFTVWPVPNQANMWTLNYYACAQMQDANLPGGETPDLPYLWLDWFAAALAHRLSRKYAPALEAVRKADAQEAWSVAATQNVENVPLSITPTLSSYYRR